MKGKLLGAIAMAVLLGTGLYACAERAQHEYVGNFEFTPENYPRMGGSLAALPLGEAVTAAVLGIDRDQTEGFILFEGSTTYNYVELIDGSFDILLAYEPSEMAVQYAKEQGFEWEMAPIGRDALVFIVNRANPVQRLTDAQIRGIYRGEIKNWSEVGGEDAAIVPYQRNQHSGSQTLFDKLVNLGDDLMLPPYELIVGTMGGLLDIVAEYDNSANAIGYTVYYYLANMEKEKLENTKILAVDGVECSNRTIRSGKYPYVNDFYVVIRKDLPEDAPARILFNWICSAQGKELIERENYVAI
ncbi:MAG: substrate-binding domain-containing protein [Clostridiales bacterium]|nr:substrate-binding domain-containing protein [Clostridiales bacterium]